jgi:transposase-like protein
MPKIPPKTQPKTKRYDAATIAAAVAALRAGEGVAAVARTLDIPESTVRTWGAQHGLDFEEIRAEKKQALEELIAEYMTEGFKTLIAQVQALRDPTYLKQYSPENVAMSHGIMADKLIRVLEAHAAAQPAETNPGGE